MRPLRIDFLTVLTFIFSLFYFSPLQSQSCDGAELYTNESYLFGRFEVSMQSAPGSGIISSFFLFNNSSGCNYPEENNEIDVEMTGNNNQIYFTSHHPGNPNPWFYGDNFDLGFSPHDNMHQYAIEWEPGIVRWFVDDELIYVQDEPEAEELMYPMAIYMNLWATEADDWAGPWNPDVMPQSAIYDYVKYYKYSPGDGNYGSNNNFLFEWQDKFDMLDIDRWERTDFSEFSLNFCTYKSGNVAVSDGYLFLTISEPKLDFPLVPVTFTTNTSEIEINTTDKVYLNGSFNDWCGNCNPMIKNGDTWELTLDLLPGKYEYLFTINTWSVVGSVPLNSECDFTPCDEFGNYGFILKEDVENLNLETFCWASCIVCQSTNTYEVSTQKDKNLIKVVDISGKETGIIFNKLLFYLYSDGTVEKKVIWSYN